VAKTVFGKRLAALVAGSAALLASSVAFGAEKVVHVYNWSDYIDASVLEDFTKETGIKVQYDVYDANEVLETKLLAGNTGYDVVVPGGAFLFRQIKAKIHTKLDKSKLPNLKNMWPMVSERLAAAYDPGNEHAVNYMWGTTGVGYNVNKIKAIMPDAPIGSWNMLFDPAVIAKFKDCGVMMLDSDEDVIPPMLSYLGLDPNTKNPADFKKAAEALQKIRPFVRKFHSSEYINAMANGDICIALGWSGDFSLASTRAEEKNATITDEAKKTQIAYFIPKEGTSMWFDNMAIPADAPNKEEAYAFINYMMRPDVIAKCSKFVGYANGNLEAQKLMDKAMLEDTTVYPDKDTQAHLFTPLPLDNKLQRARTDAWRSVKTGG
jgi:putrescine transport system substrate-binding protein